MQHIARNRPSPAVSVVVPCYNEADGLTALYERLSAICREVADQDYEILLVNDGSGDRSWEIMTALAANDANLLAVNLSRNFGHQLALSAGLSLCAGQRVLIIDADLQDPPELLPDMMKLMDEGADVVYGQRATREGETILKKASASLFYRLLDQLVDVHIPLDTGDFRLINRRSLDVLNSMPEQHRFIRGMVSWIGLRQVPLRYERQARHAGETKYALAKMLRFAVDAITSFSIRPLRQASYLGLIFGVCGLIALIYTLYGWASGQSVPGWASVMTAILIIGSAQLFVLGLMGEYVGRLYMESKGRPLFVIDDVFCAQNLRAAQAKSEKEHARST